MGSKIKNAVIVCFFVLILLVGTGLSITVWNINTVIVPIDIASELEWCENEFQDIFDDSTHTSSLIDFEGATEDDIRSILDAFVRCKSLRSPEFRALESFYRPLWPAILVFILIQIFQVIVFMAVAIENDW